MTVDIDMSGNFAQKARVYQGPTIGWGEVFIQPQTRITTAGTTALGLGTGVVLVNVAGLVTINLPDLVHWINVLPFLPGSVFKRELWIKDLGGNAAAFPITVHPFSGQKIDNLSQDFQIVEARQLLRLYPMPDATSWISGQSA